MPLNFILRLLYTIVLVEVCFSLENDQIAEVNGFKWVLASSNRSHAEACVLNGMKPTDRSMQIPWNTVIMENVTRALGKSVMPLPYGIQGCCVPGLFCDADTCFTQSLSQTFFNYESIHTISSYTVYTCLGVPPDNSLSFENIDLAVGVVTMNASHPGTDRSDVEITVAGKPCSDMEVCSNVCNSCSRLSHNCSKDSVCLSVARVSSCYMYCSGPTDATCPCGTTCQSVKVYVGAHKFLSTNICGPKDLSCSSYRDVVEAQCRSPRTFAWASDTPPPPSLQSASVSAQRTMDMAVSLTVGDRVATTTVSHLTEVCTSDGQCFDKDVFSSASCAAGMCTYSFPVNTTSAVQMPERLGSTFPAIRERNTPFSYLGLVAHDMEVEQGTFTSKMRLEGTLSAVSEVDDAPVEHHSLPFVFRFFGNDVADMNINPNGLLSLPPFTECVAMAGSLRVRPYHGVCL